MNKFIVKEVIKYKFYFTYIDWLILRTTDNIGQLEVKHSIRKFGQSNYTFIKLLFVWSNMFFNSSIIPLRISITIGFVFSIIGFVMGIIVIFLKFHEPNMPSGFASIMVSLCVFSGLFLISIGMTGEYIGRIYLSIIGEPQYIVRKSFINKE